MEHGFNTDKAKTRRDSVSAIFPLYPGFFCVPSVAPSFAEVHVILQSSSCQT
jgi:hypothetical protein